MNQQQPIHRRRLTRAEIGGGDATAPSAASPG